MSFMNPVTDQIGRKSGPVGYGGDSERLARSRAPLVMTQEWMSCGRPEEARGGLSLLSFVYLSYILASVCWPNIFLSVNE